MTNAIIRVALTVTITFLAWIVMPVLYIGVPVDVQFRHAVTVLDLQDSPERPLITSYALAVSHSHTLRWSVLCVSLLAVVASEIVGVRKAEPRRRPWCERVTYLVWTSCIGVMFLLMLGVICIIVTI